MFYAADTRRLLIEAGIPFWEAGPNVSKGWVGIRCLFCDDPSNHLGINLSTGKFSCHRCKTKGHISHILANHLRISVNRAKDLIEQQTPKDLQKHIDKQEEKAPASVDIEPSRTWTKEPSLPFRKYLEGRNFDPDKTSRLHNLWFGGPVGFFKHRIIVPITVRGRVVSYVGRDITGKQGRYKNWPVEKSIINPKHCVYGLDKCSSTVIVVEGLFDQWRIGKGSGALLGTGYTSEQVLSLIKFQRVFILFDREETAQKVARELANEIASLSSNEVFIVDPLASDPAEMSDNDVISLRKEIFGRWY